eukprot:gene51759-1931_t
MAQLATRRCTQRCADRWAAPSRLPDQPALSYCRDPQPPPLVLPLQPPVPPPPAPPPPAFAAPRAPSPTDAFLEHVFGPPLPPRQAPRPAGLTGPARRAAPSVTGVALQWGARVHGARA